jgi:hypothetical protein
MGICDDLPEETRGNLGENFWRYKMTLYIPITRRLVWIVRIRSKVTDLVIIGLFASILWVLLKK